MMNFLAPAEALLDTRYVIGLDIGDGESALAWSSTKPGDVPAVYKRKRTGERSILTALSVLRDHDNPLVDRTRTLFGEEAAFEPDAVQFVVSFKEQPTAMMLPDMQKFGSALLTEFFDTHPEVSANSLIIIGHPAGWDDSAVELYRRQLGLLGESVYLLPESQSALVRVRDLNRDQPAPLDDVLVVDIGSSTVDLTVVEDLRPRNLPVGQDLGCRLIDLELAARVKAYFARDASFTEAVASSGGEGLLLFACRRAKEAQFSGHVQSLLDTRQAQNSAYAVLADRGFGWLKGFEIQEMVMRPGGWATKFKQLLEEARQSLHKQPRIVIITGGGSRMPFVRDICRAAYPGAEVRLDEDPSLSVARGLASSGCQRVRVARFRRDMNAVVSEPGTEARIRALTEQALGEIKDSLVTALGHDQPGLAGMVADPPDWAGLIDAPPGAVEIAENLGLSVADYLVPLTQHVCGTYGIDTSKFDIRLSALELFPPELLSRISRANFEVTTADPITHLAFDLAKQGFRHGAKQAFAGVRENPRLNPAYLIGLASVGVVAGAVVAHEAVTMRRQRRTLIKLVEETELSEPAAQQVMADTLATIEGVIAERAQAVERFVT